MSLKKNVIIFIVLLFILCKSAYAQMPTVSAPPSANKQTQSQVQPTPPPVVQPKPQPKEDFTWWYILIISLVLGLIAAVYWMAISKQKAKYQSEEAKKANNKIKMEAGPIDSDNELEWLRKNQKLIDRRKKRQNQIKDNKTKLPNSNIFLETKETVVNTSVKEVQLLNKKGLPVYQIREIEMPNPFQPLPNSNDDALFGAIEQVNDEFEEDETVRDLAIRILAMFKTRNSVEALSQVALYDLSTSLRVKAVITLSEFDHESIFETILLACADPSREVRAAAARALSKVSFDRADAWARIAECGEEWKMVHAARAAIEGGFVERYFDRLISNDYKQCYEAFTLMTLLIRAGETDLIFKAINENKDINVSLALLQVIKVNEDGRSLRPLYALAAKSDLPQTLGDAVDETIFYVGRVVENRPVVEAA